MRRTLSGFALVAVLAGLAVGGVGCGSGGGSGGSVLRVHAWDGSQVGLGNYHHSRFLFGLVAVDSASGTTLECSAVLGLNHTNDTTSKTATVELPARPQNGGGRYRPAVIFDDDADNEYDPSSEAIYTWNDVQNGSMLEYKTQTGWSRIADETATPIHGAIDVSIAIYDAFD